MKGRTWMWLIIAALPTLTLAQYDGPTNYVSGYLDAEFQSLYMFRGFRFYGAQTATQVTGDLKVADSGFGMMLQPHFANGGGHVADQRWDYNPYFEHVAFPEEIYAVQYRFNYVWYNYPKRSSRVADLQELNFMLSLPNVFAIDGLAPRYQVIKMWQAKGGSQSQVSNANGWMHVFGLDYNVDLPGLTPESPVQPAKLLAEITYNDGVNPLRGGTSIDRDWSHFVLGASTDFDLGYNISITPSVYYQRTMEPDIRQNNNTNENEFWFTIAGRWEF